MRFGNTQIAVIGTVAGVKKEKVLDSTPKGVRAYLQESLDETRAYLAELKKEKASPAKIKEVEETIRFREEGILEEQAQFQAFDPGLPHSQGYGQVVLDDDQTAKGYSKLRAYLIRGSYIYVFESTERMEQTADVDVHKKNFRRLLAKFRTRAPNEIPTSPGVCVPLGFIPDDGRTTIAFKQSFRYSDAPGVLYTIDTGTVHPRRLKATKVQALARATIAPPPARENEGRAVVTERIGVRKAKLGGVEGWQGGVVMRTKTGGESHEVYSVYTGYSGWLGTAVLPYMLVEMRGISKVGAPELTRNPPPFKQSMSRLDAILKSMRWRPTNPSMPEFHQK